MSISNEALRRAAILIDSLPAETADALLDQMDNEMVQHVRNMAMQLDEVSQEERNEVIRKFVKGRPDTKSPPAQELDEVQISYDGLQPPAERVASEARDDHQRSDEAPPFQFLNTAEPPVLADLLGDESPQTIAMVMAHLEPAVAANVLGCFSDDEQVVVLRRIARFSGTTPEIIREVESHLRQQLQERDRAEASAGMATVHAIVQAADKQQIPRLLASAAQVDQVVQEDQASQPAPNARELWAPTSLWSQTARRGPATGMTQPSMRNTNVPRELAPIAEAPRPQATEQVATKFAGSATENDLAVAPEQMPATAKKPSTDSQLEFDDFVRLDNRSLFQIFKTAHPNVSLLALTGAPAALVHRILKQLDRQDAKIVQQRIEQSGPTRLSDIEQAQQRLIAIAEELAAQGKIQLPQTRAFNSAA